MHMYATNSLRCVELVFYARKHPTHNINKIKTEDVDRPDSCIWSRLSPSKAERVF